VEKKIIVRASTAQNIVNGGTRLTLKESTHRGRRNELY